MSHKPIGAPGLVADQRLRADVGGRAAAGAAAAREWEAVAGAAAAREWGAVAGAAAAREWGAVAGAAAPRE
jgi:hypothetical protein